jgi:predicted metallopeptidase
MMKKKKNKNEIINSYFDYMKTNKDSFINIVKNVKVNNNKATLEIFQDAIYRTNKIVIHTYNFLKLYILYLYDNKLDIPLIDEDFIKIIMRIVSVRNDKRGCRTSKNTLKIMNNLTIFYDKYYKKTIDENNIVNDDKLSYILAYEAIDIVKNISTNIKEHYVDHVCKLINIKFGWKKEIAKINDNNKLNKNEKKEARKQLYQKIFAIKTDMLDIEGNDLISDEKYHKWIKNNKYYIIPVKDTYQKNSINYDVCCSPQDYLESMIYINKELAKLSTEDNPIKLFNALPLRTRIIPNYVTFDTASIISLLIEKDTIGFLSNIKLRQKEIWDKFFQTNKRVFKKNNYCFNFMIKTDGVGCSILFIKTDSDGKPNKLNSYQLKQLDKLKDTNDKKYIENQDNIKEILDKKNYVCIDPNLSDLMYCMDKNGTKFRYTQNQRRLESRNKKYMKIIEDINTKTNINGKTIKQIESELSKYNSKTCDFNEFTDYLKIKNRINRILFEQYQKKIYRKLKWNRFINTQKSESKMLNNFEKRYGGPKLTNVIIGDYDKPNNPRGKEPCITKKIRKLLKLFGYSVYLINEFRTSKLCNKCHSEVENFMERSSTKPKDEGKNILVWGLVCCTNEKCKPNTKSKKQINNYGSNVYNRDTNAVLNMLNITKQLIKTGKRPKIFTKEE